MCTYRSFSQLLVVNIISAIVILLWNSKKLIFCFNNRFFLYLTILILVSIINLRSIHESTKYTLSDSQPWIQDTIADNPWHIRTLSPVLYHNYVHTTLLHFSQDTTGTLKRSSGSNSISSGPHVWTKDDISSLKLHISSINWPLIVRKVFTIPGQSESRLVPRCYFEPGSIGPC